VLALIKSFHDCELETAELCHRSVHALTKATLITIAQDNLTAPPQALVVCPSSSPVNFLPQGMIELPMHIADVVSLSRGETELRCQVTGCNGLVALCADRIDG